MRSHEMTAHSDLLDRYKRIREVRFRLNNLLVGTIPKKTLEDCGRKLGLFRKGTLVFGSEDEMSVLMDYCLYHPEPDGRNLVAKYLEKSPPPADSDEMIALALVSRKKCTNPCSCETIVCTIPVASAAWCDRQA